MVQRRPTRRRGDVAPTVDHQAVVGYILRRCRGCSLDYHLTVARNLFEARPFPSEDQDRILSMLRDRLRHRTGLSDVVPETMNGTVTCSHCGRPIGNHPTDPEKPHLVVLCTGLRVRVV